MTTTSTPRIRTTFSQCTPESAADGDFSDTGWIDDEGDMIEADVDNDTVAAAAIAWLKDVGATEASCSPGCDNGHCWFSTAWCDTDYATGEQEQRSFHLVGFTDAEHREIYNGIVGASGAS